MSTTLSDAGLQLADSSVISSATQLGMRNLLINPRFQINQRGYVSGTATGGVNQYCHDRWRIPTTGQSVTFSTTAGTTTVTTPASGYEQVIENLNVIGGNYVFWMNGSATTVVVRQSADNVTYSVVTPTNGQYAITGGNYVKVNISGGTVSYAMFELAATASRGMDYRPYSVELALGQRYFEVLVNTQYAPSDGTNNVFGGVWHTEKRTIPTLTYSANFTFTSLAATTSGWYGYIAGISSVRSVTSITAAAEL